jgi:hypothetical protein
VATPFAEQEAGATRRQQRLHADDQSRHASRQTLFDGHEHPAQIQRVHQQAGNTDMESLTPIARPWRTRRQGEARHQGEHQNVAGEQEGQRFGVRQPELGADETGAPEENKQEGQQRWQGAHGIGLLTQGRSVSSIVPMMAANRRYRHSNLILPG